MDLTDKRKYPRFIVNGLDVHGKVLWSTEVKIHDISLGGAHISLNRRLNIGSEYIIQLMYKDDEIVPIKGIVVWEELKASTKNERGEVVPIYSAGIEFKDVVTTKGSDLIDFMEKLTSNSALRLKGIRIKLHAPQKVVLKYPQNYIVKKISMGGMLIETAEEFPVEARFPMEIILPGNTEPIMFLGRVASCSLIADSSPKHYEIGIEFIEMDENGRTKIEKFIAAIRKL